MLKKYLILTLLLFIGVVTVVAQKNDGIYKGTISGAISESFGKNPDDPSEDNRVVRVTMKEITFKVDGEFLKGELTGESQSSSTKYNNKRDWNNYFTCDLNPAGDFLCEDASAGGIYPIILNGTLNSGVISGTWSVKRGGTLPTASGNFKAEISGKKQETNITVAQFGEDGIHHPLEFQISVTRDNKPLANAPITFDVTGEWKALRDQFLVFDSESKRWIPVTADKAYGSSEHSALRSNKQGVVNIRFLADLGLIRSMNIRFPFQITLTVFCQSDGSEKRVSASANLEVKHLAFVRSVYFENGSVTYPDPITREKVIRRGGWLNVATEMADENWKIYDRISFNGKPFKPINPDASYWSPIENGALLKLDYSQRSTENRSDMSGQEKFWQPPLGSGIGFNIEWIDGTQGQFAIHNDDNSSKSILAMRLPDSAGRVPGQQFDRVLYFAIAQAKEEVVETTLQDVSAAYALMAGPQAAAAVAIGWIVYEVYDKSSDAAELLGILTTEGAKYDGGGTFVQIKSKVAQFPNPKGGLTLYTFEGSPSVFDKNGKAVTAKAGQAIDFKVGGDVSQPVFREPPESAKAALQLLEKISYSGSPIKQITTSEPSKTSTADVENLLKLGTAQHKTGNYTEAIAAYDQALKIAPLNAEAFRLRGIAKREAKDIDGAIKDFNRAIEIAPNDMLFASRGIAKERLEDFKGALADYDRAIQLNPEWAWFYFLRAYLRSNKFMDYAGAIADYNKVIELTPNDWKAWSNRAYAKMSINDNQGAIADYEKSLAINPNDEFAKKNLLILREKLAQPATAEKELFFNGNDYGVGNGGKSPTFTLTSASKITFMMTYHWNSGKGAVAGTITLIGEDGKQYGPWQVTLNNNVYWEIRPDTTLPAGRYKVIDSDPATWAQNSGSSGFGMVRIKGYEVSDVAANSDGKAISLPAPTYPPAARVVQASGKVEVQVTIDESGNVISASAISGHPLLRTSAEEAARQAKFSPAIKSGQSVKITKVIIYDFVGDSVKVSVVN